MTFRWIFRIDTCQRLLRIARVTWICGAYSAKFSVALSCELFRWFERDALSDWRVTFFGLCLHYCRSYGGIFAP